MQEKLFTKQSRLNSIFIRLGLSLALGVLTILLPIGLVSGASPFLDPVDQPDSAFAASDIGWNTLPHRGLNSRIRAIVLAGDSLYMGGKFTQTNDGWLTDLGRVIHYDIAGGTWNALPNQGLNEEVFSLAVVEGDLYAGGGFTQTVDTAVPDLGYIAHYDPGVGTWNALPNEGLDGSVFALAMAGDDLYTGGVFTQSGDGAVTNLNHIARFDTLAGTWNALPNEGLYGSVFALAVAGDDLYTGGVFTQSGDGAVTNLNHIARFDTLAGTWQALPNQGLDGSVNAILVSGSDVYVGGYFTQTGDGAVTNLNHIARYDTLAGTWHALPNQGLNDDVFAFSVLDDDLYVAGAFDQTADGSLTNLGYIARYDTAAGTWQALPNQGLNGWVYVLTAVNSDLYVGGEFSQVGNGIVPGLSHIARFGEADRKLYLPLVIR